MLLKEKAQLLSNYNTQNTPNKSLGEANALRNKLSTTEKRSEELQSLLHNTVLEKEMLKSKLETQISVLQR